jgi:hypothetical protein
MGMMGVSERRSGLSKLVSDVTAFTIHFHPFS